jgi:chromosome segregation ATPase
MSTPNMKSFCIAVVQPYIRSVIDFFKSAIEYIEGKQAIQDDKITGVLNSNAELTTRVETAESDVSQLSDALQQMRKDFDEASDFASVEEIKATVTQHTTEIAKLQSDLGEVPTTISNLEKKVNTNTKNITANKNSIATVKTAAETTDANFEASMDAIRECTLFDSEYQDHDGSYTWNSTKYKPYVNSYNENGEQVLTA